MRILFYVWGALFFLVLLKWWLVDNLIFMAPTIDYIMYLLIWIGGLLFFGIAALLSKSEQASEAPSVLIEPTLDPSITRFIDNKSLFVIVIVVSIVGLLLFALLSNR